MFYGRTDDEWHSLIAEGVAFLIERAKLGKVTSYTEMNTVLERRTGVRAFDFSREDERAAMGHLLGEISHRAYPTSQCLISALVNYLDENDAGPGFYKLAQDLGMLSRTASSSQKWEFWVQQVKAAHDYYR